MKYTHIFLLIITLLCNAIYTNINAQDAIQYSYDAAGNRITRKIVISPPLYKMALPDSVTPAPQEQAMKIAMHYGISVYPNPASDQVNVTVSSVSDHKQASKKATAYLYDNTGRLLFSKPVFAAPSPIDLSTYRAGIYYIKVTIGKEQLFYQVVKSE